MVPRHPVLIFITEKHGNYFAYVQMFNSRALSKYTLRLRQEEKSVNRVLLHLWIRNSALQQNHQNQKVVRSLLLKTVVSGKAQNGVALGILDQDCVAVLGSPLPTSQECLSIWNTNFQPPRVPKELPPGTSSQLWYYGGHVFMLHGKLLTEIPNKCEVPSLAGALGKRKHRPGPCTQAVPQSVNWETSQRYGLGPQNSEPSKRILRRRKTEASIQPEAPASKQLLKP
ncbi:hypothetical protein QTO34_013549 [Cnephaeus nilssonii]|uniref:Nucleolar protein 11 N-terminal domain-containing protein n=1 Tax=Cnephaeus nilssonii TaxID=3371016 RepID=A0AA40I886_CNENI|nr:hypothetical protein QTO34_013549 [Eptesicus nilssonii]